MSEAKEIKRITDLIKGDFHDEMANLLSYGVSQKTIAMLVNIHVCTQEELEINQAQISALTKENEELKVRLSSYENGMDIEYAKKDGTSILAWKRGSLYQPEVMHYEFESGAWGRLTEAMGFIPAEEQPDRYVPLPPTQEGEPE